MVGFTFTTGFVLFLAALVLFACAWLSLSYHEGGSWGDATDYVAGGMACLASGIGLIAYAYHRNKRDSGWR